MRVPVVMIMRVVMIMTAHFLVVMVGPAAMTVMVVAQRKCYEYPKQQHFEVRRNGIRSQIMVPQISLFSFQMLDK